MTATDVPELLEKLGQEPVDLDGPGDDDLRMWSVTTLIGVLEKKALQYWRAYSTADAAIDDRDIWVPMAEKNRKDARKWLADAAFRTPEGERTASDLGEVVHEACEQYALTGVRPEVDDEVTPFLDQFDRWAQKAQPAYQATEVCVYHPTMGYAGTADAFLTVGGMSAIVDYKTSKDPYDSKGKRKTPYPEVALQLAAYRHAEFAAVWRPRRFEKYWRRYYLLSQEEREKAVPVPQVEGGLCIFITPEWCEAFPVRCDETVWEYFLYIQEAARWKFEVEKTVIGDPLEFEEAS